jgi:hypothetical protein
MVRRKELQDLSIERNDWLSGIGGEIMDTIQRFGVQLGNGFILSEKSCAKACAERMWVDVPVAGTTAYISGIHNPVNHDGTSPLTKRNALAPGTAWHGTADCLVVLKDRDRH